MPVRLLSYLKFDQNLPLIFSFLTITIFLYVYQFVYALTKEDYIRFRDLREFLKTTDSNLFSNLRGLEKDSLIEATIKIEGKNSKTYCRITSKGKEVYSNFCKSIVKVMNTDVLTIANR